MSLPLAFRVRPAASWVATNSGNQCVAGVVYYRQDAGKDYSCLVANNLGNSFRLSSSWEDLVLGQTDRTRSELQSSVKLPVGVDLWSAQTIIAHNNLPDIAWDDWVIDQTHQTEDPGDASGYPPVEANLKPGGWQGDKYYARLHIYTATNPVASDPNFYPRTLRCDVAFSLGEPHDLVAMKRFAWDGSGALHVWLDGVHIVAADNISMGMNDASGPYHKLGTYWHPLTPGRLMTVEHFHIVPPGPDDLSFRIDTPPGIW